MRIAVASLAIGVLVAVVAADPAPPAPAAPSWTATLPFAPDAARVSGERLEIARVAASAIEYASAPVDAEGIPEPAEGAESPWSPTASHPFAGAPPTVLAAGERNWYGWSGESKTLTVYAPDFSSATATCPAEFARVDAIAESGGRVLLLGGSDGTVAAHLPADAISPTATWTKSAPMPVARQDAGLAVVGDLVLAIGGEEEGGATPRHVFATKLGADGAFGPWTTPVALRFSDPIGPARAATASGAIAAIARTHSPTGPLRMATTVVRGDGSMALWRIVDLEAPPADDAIVVGNESNQQAIVLGGRSSTGGSPTATARAWPMTATAAALAKINKETLAEKAQFAPGRQGNAGRPRLKAGRARAESEGKYLFLIVAGEGDDAPNKTMRLHFAQRENVHAMLMDVVVAQAWPEEIAEAKALTGIEELPHAALFDSSGKLVGSIAGVPTDQQMFELMKVLWEPRAGGRP